MNVNRRGFLGGLFAVAAVAAAPVIWTAQKVKRLFVNVKDYGATGDGVTDDAAAFQAALNDVGPEGTVFIPEGTYYVGSLDFRKLPPGAADRW